MSPTVPPATLRKALPENPLRNRPISSVWVFSAKAHGKIQIRKSANEHK